ncbi:MAG: ribonuclease HII [Candidatus Diapherotrites archaeon]|nr:ribonuclease HII [Candidatus Diapherotrites archaeon]
MIIAGVDEAGRGPVIGPMVLAVAVLDDEDEQKLLEMEIRDSKLIAPKKRKKLHDWLIAELFESAIISVSPSELDLLMQEHSLNEIEAMKIAEAINAIDSRFGRIYVDSPDTEAPRFARRIRKYLDNPKVDIVSEHKADVNYPIVGAASILAKVTRDSTIEVLREELGDFGSGYPSDPKTKAFIEDYFSKNESIPHFMRSAWKTLDKYKKKPHAFGQQTLF